MNQFVLFSCLMAMVSGQSIVGSAASVGVSPKNIYQEASTAGLLQPTSPITASGAASHLVTPTTKAKVTTSSEYEVAAATTAAAVNLINHGAEGDMHGAELRNHLLYFGIGCNRNCGGRGEPQRDLDRDCEREYEHGCDREINRDFQRNEIGHSECCASGLCEGRAGSCLGRFCNIFNCANCGGQGGNGVRHDYERANSGSSCLCPQDLCPHHAAHHPCEPPRYPNEPPRYPNEPPLHPCEPPHHHVPSHAPLPPHHRPEPHHNVDPHHQAPCVDPYSGERGRYHDREVPQHIPYGASLVVNDKTVTHTATRTSTHLSYATTTYTTVITATKTHTDLRYPVETHTKIEHETAYQYPAHPPQATPSPCW